MNIRKEIVDAVLNEIIGPSPNSHYKTKEGEEILLKRVHGSPQSRYGAAMLYPLRSLNTGVPGESGSKDDELIVAADEGEAGQQPGINENTTNDDADSSDEEPVGLANQFLPSAMGFTVRFRKKEMDDRIVLNVSSAHYIRGEGQLPVKRINREDSVEGATTKDGGPLLSDYWIRKSFTFEPLELHINSLFSSGVRSINYILKKTENGADWLKLQVYNRTPADEKDLFLTFTFVLINVAEAITDNAVTDNLILYQNQLSLAADNENLIAPYREKNASNDTTEEKELNLLYRKKRVFAIGHGTAVNWEADNNKKTERVKYITTAVIPVYEMPQVAPSGDVELSMLALSDLGNWEEAKNSLQELAEKYEAWINRTEQEALSDALIDYRDAALLNVKKCRATLERIKNGINLLNTAAADSPLVRCFRWMNRAMIWQQQRSKARQRKWIRSGIGNHATFTLEGVNGSSEMEFVSLQQFHEASRYNGRWRPFQLAFILMNIDSVINPNSYEREIVDLIWFPTGGGKTEAYLGLTAFTIFFRRIQGLKHMNLSYFGGTTVLMRYTLRLLTTQQYERAASLICACDLIRKDNIVDLGTEPISIGLWVGGGSSPNRHEDAVAQFGQLTRNNNAEYNFIVMKCPSCGAQIGKVDQPTQQVRIKGIIREDGNLGKVVFRCGNPSCEYGNRSLPLTVVDEYMYDQPPTLLLGTVDKFAMIPWKTEAGKFFGFRQINGAWKRISPPELIIQDELHLIAGPLGTMVGLYESMVQTLCNNYGLNSYPFLPEDTSTLIVPKIVASSATISRAGEQVKCLYGTNNLHIFPSQGLEFGNTWFSEEKPVSDEHPGRMYVGILASGYPSAQTSIVRAYSAVLQRAKELETEKNIDYYWTLLGYFNSIRELGGASSLVFGDIRERLSQIQNRELVVKEKRRYLNRNEELTSRISASDIPEALKKLETKISAANHAIDTCLATNMVATGVDISRLGLMFIHGQPKTTAEYIQASSRVGRDLPNGPGLVFTLYSPSKPRDKSQYEQFQGYHSRIYSNVEPTSVTPFSINAREKALHAIFVGMVRHFAENTLRESATISGDFTELKTKIRKILLDRCEVIDKNEVHNTDKMIDKIVRFWEKGFQQYGDAGNFGILRNSGFVPLLYASSAEVRQDIIIERKSLATPTSMRGVDTESVVNIYTES